MVNAGASLPYLFTQAQAGCEAARHGKPIFPENTAPCQPPPQGALLSAFRTNSRPGLTPPGTNTGLGSSGGKGKAHENLSHFSVRYGPGNGAHRNVFGQAGANLSLLPLWGGRLKQLCNRHKHPAHSSVSVQLLGKIQPKQEYKLMGKEHNLTTNDC